MRELAVCNPTHDDETVMNGAPGVVRGGERVHARVGGVRSHP